MSERTVISQPSSVPTNAGTPEQQQDLANANSSELADQPQDLEEVVVRSVGDRTSISRFMAENRLGFARSNRFFVEITSAPGIELLPRQFAFMCEGAEIPGRELTTSDTRIYGPTYKSPYLSTYNDVTLTVLCDYQLSEKRFFDAWLDYINPTTNFNFSYRDGYVTDVSIFHLNETNNITYGIRLKEAYPVSVGSLQATWGDDNIHRLQVGMTYRYWQQVIEPSDLDLSLYEEKRFQHELNVQNAALESGFGSPVTDAAAHRRRINRTLEESSNRFKKVIADLAST